MEIRGEHSLNLFLQTQQKTAPPPLPPLRHDAKTKPPPSKELTLVQSPPPPPQGGTQLVSDILEELENGVRRIQIFEREDGRRFTRTEEQTTTLRGSQRNVVQQNPSGNTTFLEESLERTSDGLFQRTLRFTDEAGEQSTKIETGFFPPPSGPFEVPRGQHLDLEA